MESERRTRVLHQVCIDVDTHPEKRQENWVIAMCKAMYAYNWIPRRIVKTKHGYHIYLQLPREHKANIPLRAMLGDDPGRLQADQWRLEHGYKPEWTDLCFLENEEHEVTP